MPQIKANNMRNIAPSAAPQRRMAYSEERSPPTARKSFLSKPTTFFIHLQPYNPALSLNPSFLVWQRPITFSYDKSSMMVSTRNARPSMDVHDSGGVSSQSNNGE